MIARGVRGVSGALGRGMSSMVRVGSVGELEMNDSKVVKVPVAGKEVELLLVRTRSGVSAVANRCPHYGLPLTKAVIHHDKITCPFHGACFHAHSGEIEDGPALNNLATFRTEVSEDGGVFVEVGSESVGEGGLAFSVEPGWVGGDGGVGSDRVVVVVGGGAGALGAVEELRRSGFGGEVVVFSREQWPLVDRPVLSKAPSNARDASSLCLRAGSFYDRIGVRVERGADVEQVDVERKVVRVRRSGGSGGGGSVEEVGFDKVLLCTGARPRRFVSPERIQIIGSELKGLVAVRSVEDAEELMALVEEEGAGRGAGSGDGGEDGMRDVVVLGSSFLGLEVAAFFASKYDLTASSPPFRVTVVGMEEQPLERVLGDRAGKALRMVHEDKGVRFEMGQTIAAFLPKEGQDRVGKVRLTGRKEEGGEGAEIGADVVVIAAGAILNTELLEAIPGAKRAEKGGGMEVDSFLRLAKEAGGEEGVFEDVFVAGDIASVPMRGPDGKMHLMRAEHWDVAIDQGRVAARNIVKSIETAQEERGGSGEGGVSVAAASSSPSSSFEAYAVTPFFWTGQLGKNIRYAGHATTWDELIWHGDDKVFTAYYVQDGVVAAVATLQDDPNAVAAKELLRLGRMPSPETLRAAQEEGVRTDLAKVLAREGGEEARPKM